MVKFKRAHPDVPNVFNAEPPTPLPREKVRFSFRVDPVTAARLPELEQRIQKYKNRKARYSSEKIVRTLSLDPEVHAWMKAEADKCDMTLGRFVGRLLNDPDLDESASIDITEGRAFIKQGDTWHRLPGNTPWVIPDPGNTATWTLPPPDKEA